MILLDCDGVLGDFASEVLWFCNTYSVERNDWTIDDIADFDILATLGCSHLQERLDQHMIDTDFCRHMPVYPGAQAFVEKLQSISEVIIVTSSYTAVPNWDSARREWLREHFDIPKRNVVFTSRKELVKGDYLIDDRLENCVAYGKERACCFSRPWNVKYQGLRALDYDHAIWMLSQ